ncbi:MAG TPA: glycoside hydrolase family 15 protein [Candidatus Dormibacteraeota bacterium]|nr:glycoside hydrolase family 15 protein [Candidatus Dormibacteraeota bacterium]
MLKDVDPGPFPPIAEYAFLADGEVNALIAPSGNVEWMCLPRPDGPSIFGAILDRTAGGFRVGPADVMVPVSRRYLPGTLVMETTWRTKRGWIVVRDALLVGPWHDVERRSEHFRRPPTDNQAEHVMVRTVRCLNGTVELSLECEPVGDYGRAGADWSYNGDGYGCAEARVEGYEANLQLSTSFRLGFEGRKATARTTLGAGETAFAAFSWTHHDDVKSFEDASARIERTAQFWRDWLNHGTFPDHPWSPILERSALTLKGLIYTPTGALLAAATTSLPETPHGERNWDYRFSWIRDSTFILWALYTLGFDHEANDFFAFIGDATEKDGELQIMYGIDGERRLEEKTLDHLSGYDRARPVRIGNAAYKQKQHDVWGAVMDSVYLHTKSRDALPERVWPLLNRAVEEAIANWRKPDQGIWEVRGPAQHFTSSKLMCWVAVDRGARLALLRGEAEVAKRWGSVAAEIHADICKNGVDSRGVFIQAYGNPALDASVLLMPLFRFLPPTDERIKKTVCTIAEELTVDGLVLRYRVDQINDGLTGEEGTFTICSFWLVSALSEIGERQRARHLCEKMLSFASPLGLYAEEIDPRNARHLGNFPQAFTHLALINAVMHVIRSDEGDDSKRFAPARALIA